MNTANADFSGQVEETNIRQYWMAQIGGWSAMALLSYLSLNIWYTPGQLEPVFHSILQSAAGLLISHPLRRVAIASWNLPIPLRVFLNATGILVAALIWTVWRIQSFTWLTGEIIDVPDWGGWINASVIVFGAWSFCYHAFCYYRQWLVQRQVAIEAHNEALVAQASAQRETMKRLEAEKLFREAQLMMLKFQLNPHFLLNSLNSVSALIRRGDRERATDMVARIGDFLRLSLTDPEEVHHSLEEEISAIEIYLGIEKVRFGDRLQTCFSITDDARAASIPNLLLQPVFENSVKFAVGARLEPTLISFTASVEAGQLHLRLADNGPGIDLRKASEPETGHGIGLANVRHRLESTYGERFTLELSSADPHGLVVDIRIDLE